MNTKSSNHVPKAKDINTASTWRTALAATRNPLHGCRNPFPKEKVYNRFEALKAEEEEDDTICQTCEIRTVTETRGDTLVWADLGVGEITVDSAADESCWPKGLGGGLSRQNPPKRTSC